MNSLYLSFPEPGTVEVREERVALGGPNEVLLRAERSLISTGTELYCLRGIFDPGTNWASWVQYPFRPGYSMAATVVEAGAAVDKVRAGDRVIISAPHQQYMSVSPERLMALPEGVSWDEAPWWSLANQTQVAFRRADLELGESVAVVGLGLLGQLITQYLYVVGARRVIAIDLAQGRLDLARAHGATHAIRGTAQDALPAIREITGGKMLDAVWDVTGIPTVLATCIPLLRKRARVVLVGDTPTPTQQYLGPGVLSNSISILGVHGSSSPADYSEFTPWTAWENTALFFDYLLQGRMRVADLITDRYSPAEAAKAYAALVEDRTRSLGVLFDWDRI
jgi:threonine dehydrogenase-like Zn-dependent dehydrogenase